MQTSYKVLSEFNEKQEPSDLFANAFSSIQSGITELKSFLEKYYTNYNKEEFYGSVLKIESEIIPQMLEATQMYLDKRKSKHFSPNERYVLIETINTQCNELSEIIISNINDSQST